MEQVVLLVPLSRGMVALSLEPKLEKKWYLACSVGSTCLARSIDRSRVSSLKVVEYTDGVDVFFFCVSDGVDVSCGSGFRKSFWSTGSSESVFEFLKKYQIFSKKIPACSKR
jgi:hypothetical protein